MAFASEMVLPWMKRNISASKVVVVVFGFEIMVDTGVVEYFTSGDVVFACLSGCGLPSLKD